MLVPIGLEHHVLVVAFQAHDGVVHGSACQAAIASSVNQTVRLPRWRKAASYSAQFATLCFCLGMWWRRSWFSLNGKVGFGGSGAGRTSYATQPPPPTSRSVQQGSGRKLGHSRARNRE